MKTQSMNINGVNFPMVEKQDRHFNQDITGRVIAHFWNMRKLPDEKQMLWETKQYLQVSPIAYFKAQEKGTSFREELHKTLWWMLMNSPSTLVMYTNKIDDKQFGIIKFCLTHGITVAIEDETSKIKTIIQPVINLFDVDLFKKFKVEAIDINALSPERQEEAYTKRQLLNDARNMYMQPIWQKVNDALQEFNDFYKELKLESIEEKRIWADRYRTNEILQAYGANISIYDLDKPEVLDAIIQDLTIWAPAFEINVKLQSGTPDTMTYATRIELTPSNLTRETITMVRPIGTATKEALTTPAYLKKMLKIKQSLKRDDLHVLVESYIQVQFYKQHTEEFISDMYYICETCGHPTHRNADACPYCSTPNTDKIPEFESYNTTNEYVEAEEM